MAYSRYNNDMIVFSASANANSVSLAEGDDSLSLNALTGSTVVAAGGADTVAAALTVAGS